MTDKFEHYGLGRYGENSIIVTFACPSDLLLDDEQKMFPLPSTARPATPGQLPTVDWLWDPEASL